MIDVRAQFELVFDKFQQHTKHDWAAESLPERFWNTPDLEPRPMFSNHAPSATPPSLAKLVCIWLGIIFYLKWPTLTEAPVWDAAFGLFPAAAELADNGFNLPSLLQQPTFWEGGPNCHAESIVTWITAVVLWLVEKGPRAFVVLHVLHFGAAAWTLAVLHRLTAKTLGHAMAWLLCGTLLLCPMFRVQVGAMYFEIPLAACTVSAVAAYADGKLGRALIWSTLAVMVKQSGLVVAGALAAAALLRRVPVAKRLGLALSFACLGLAVGIGPLLFSPALAAVTDSSPSDSWWEFMRRHHVFFLRSVPDVTAGYCLLLVVGLLRLRETWRSLVSETPSDPLATPTRPRDETISGGTDEPDVSVSSSRRSLPPNVVGVAYLLLVMFGLFFFITPYFAHLDFYCLPRYFVSILPLMFFVGTYWLATLTAPRLAAIALAIMAMLFVGNRNGEWYPLEDSNHLSVHERSESYRLIVAAQQEVVLAASDLPDNAVIFYGLPEHYFLKYPWMGYAARRHPGGRCVSLRAERPKSAKTEDLPEQFFVILDDRFLGGRELRMILRAATKNPSREVSLLRQVQNGPFAVSLFELKPKSPSPNPP